MDKDKKVKPKEDKENKKTKKEKSEGLDEELEQTFPASDPPSHTQPGNDEIESRE